MPILAAPDSPPASSAQNANTGRLRLWLLDLDLCPWIDAAPTPSIGSKENLQGLRFPLLIFRMRAHESCRWRFCHPVVPDGDVELAYHVICI